MKSIALCILLSAGALAGQVSVYVTGNNETANDTRHYLSGRKRSCIVPVQHRSEAQAILDVEEAAGVREAGILGGHQASAQLLDASTGDILWNANSRNGLLGLKLEMAVCKGKVAIRGPQAAAVVSEHIDPPQLPSAPGNTSTSIFVDSSPSGASISLNGKSLGVTPASLAAEPGPAELIVRKQGYKSWSLSVEIFPGKHNQVRAVLEEEPSATFQSAASQSAPSTEVLAPLRESATTTMSERPQLTITSEPGGADIEIDSEFVGNTPSTITSNEGNVTVTIKKNGFQTVRRTVKLNAGDKRTISAQMAKESGIRIQQ